MLDVNVEVRLLPPLLARRLVEEYVFILLIDEAIIFDTVRELARDFQVSLTATAIRLIELGSYPAMIVCNEPDRRRWFIRNSDVPDVLWPGDTPGAYTSAYDLLRGSIKPEGPVSVQADGWINHPQARGYNLLEDSIRMGDEFVLSLIWWRDERQLLDINEDD